MTDEKATIKAYLRHRVMEYTHSYVARGRRFEALTEDKLNEGWASAFIALCADGDRTRAIDSRDLTAEISLRKLRTPVHLVEHAKERIRARSRLVAEKNSEQIDNRINVFVDEWTAPKN
jgi:hypothetical protein